jgi:hypothetical protein
VSESEAKVVGWEQNPLLQKIGFAPFTVKQFYEDEIEPIPWAVNGELIMESGFTTISGEGGIGKSYLLISLAIALASGTPWFGFFDVTRPYKVLYIDMEMPAKATKLRFQRMTRGAFKEPLEMLEANLMVIGQGIFSVDNTEGVEALNAVVRKEKIDFVLIDSFRQIFGGDEKDSQFTVKIFKELSKIRNQHNCGFIFIDHQRKPSGIAELNKPKDRLTGSANKRNNLDNHIVAEEGPVDDSIHVIPEKDRHGEGASGTDPFDVHFDHDDRNDENGPFRLIYDPEASGDDQAQILRFLKTQPDGAAPVSKIQLDTSGQKGHKKAVQRATAKLVKRNLLKKQWVGRVMWAILQLDK